MELYRKIIFLITILLVSIYARKEHVSGSGFDFSKLLDSRPPNAPASFDCKARELAYDYAQKIQGWRGNLQSVFDGLELGTKCNQELPKGTKPKKFLFKPTESASSTFYVDALKGDDSNPGTISKPFRTIQRGVSATRGVQSTNNFLVLREGTFYLENTIRLGPEDSGLTITNYNGEKVFVSGGLPLQTTWKPYKVDTKPTIEVYPNQNNVWGQAISKGDTATIKYLGIFDTVQQCQDACVNFNRDGQTCHSFTFHSPQSNTGYSKQCFGNVDFTWGPTPEGNITSGRIVQSNIYVADLKGQNIKSIPGLQQVDGTARVIRARYPNADTETVVFPAGWVLFSESYLPPKKYSDAVTVAVQSPQRNDFVEFQQYSIGIGGSCEIFTPPESYWCSAYCSGGGAGLFETPTGVVYNDGTFLNKWDDSNDVVVQMFHPYHWSSWMYKLDHHDPSTNTLSWSYGGFQGARGAVAGNGAGGEWYIENIFEQLDSPNEYYYDTKTQQLYFFYNATDAPPADLQLVATNLKTLFDVRGTMEEPVMNLTIQGINFVNAAYTYLDPHGVPSGGDWAMQRMGALFFEGTESLMVDNCLFQRLDGNALMLSGYHRNATIQNSEFVWIGESAMVAWGYSEGMDGTNGEQPRFTNIIGNLVHELGHFEKQSSPWFQAITCQTLLKENIFFNGPRALINFNDGFGGANEIINNLLFNPNRETSDQGPFNSWDRMPFLTDVRNGTPSLIPSFNEIHRNFFLCNYGSNMCIDNDDGSSYYENHHNFEVYGGHKSDFGGHNKFTYDTVMAYAQDYTEGLCGDFWASVPGYVDGYWNNICVQGQIVPYISMSDCNPSNPDPTTLPILNDNKIYNAAANITVQCGNTILTEAKWQEMGFDLGTKAYPMPTDDEIIAWGKALLGM